MLPHRLVGLFEMTNKACHLKQWQRGVCGGCEAISQRVSLILILCQPDRNVLVILQVTGNQFWEPRRRQ